MGDKAFTKCFVKDFVTLFYVVSHLYPRIAGFLLIPLELLEILSKSYSFMSPNDWFVPFGNIIKLQHLFYLIQQSILFHAINKICHSVLHI